MTFTFFLFPSSMKDFHKVFKIEERDFWACVALKLWTRQTFKSWLICEKCRTGPTPTLDAVRNLGSLPLVMILSKMWSVGWMTCVTLMTCLLTLPLPLWLCAQKESIVTIHNSKQSQSETISGYWTKIWKQTTTTFPISPTWEEALRMTPSGNLILIDAYHFNNHENSK